MFNVEAGKSAYLESAKHWVELDYERRIAQASNPAWGGTWASIKQFGNEIFRPIKVLTSFALGINGSPESVEPTATMPDDLKGGVLAGNLEKSREFQLRIAEHKANGWGEFLGGNFSAGFRKWREAKHETQQEMKVIMPDDGPNALMGFGSMVLSGLMYVGISIIRRKATNEAGGVIDKVADAGSSIISNTESLGHLSSPTFAATTEQAVDQISRIS